MGDVDEDLGYHPRPPSRTAQRERECMRLRHEEGLTFAVIAERLGYANRAGAKKAYDRAMAAGGLAELTDLDWRKVQIHRLEHLYGIASKQADRGDLSAVRECARILDRIESLQGLGVARGRTSSSGSGDHDHEEGTVVGEDRLRELREKRAQHAADRSALS